LFKLKSLSSGTSFAAAAPAINGEDSAYVSSPCLALGGKATAFQVIFELLLEIFVKFETCFARWALNEGSRFPQVVKEVSVPGDGARTRAC
jgi:hypothetical protein